MLWHDKRWVLLIGFGTMGSCGGLVQPYVLRRSGTFGLSIRKLVFQVPPLSERSEAKGTAATHYMNMSSRRYLHATGSNEPPIQVEMQKERALALWNTVKSSLVIDKETARDVEVKLESGFVPPVFHAYCALHSSKATPLNALDIKSQQDGKPSALPARVGSVSRLQDGVLSSSVGYRSAFFDENGNARLRVEEVGRNQVWYFMDIATEHICKLVNADAEMVGEDVEVTSVESDLYIGHAVVGNGDYLITRRASRGVVAEALGLPPEATRAVVGTEGIGKSWTLIYALQQALLYNGACVLFIAAKARVMWACLRQEDKIYVWRAPQHETSCLFGEANCLVLVDPQEARGGGTYIPSGERRAISAAYNHVELISTDMIKKNPKAKLYLSLPSTEEVCMALPYMLRDQKGFDRAEILERVGVIGPLPRWLLDEKMFEWRKRQIDRAILWTRLMSPEGMKTLFLSDGFMRGNDELPGTLYALSAERQTDEGGDFVETGYDGSGLLYTELMFSFASSYVSNKIIRFNRKNILSIVGMLTSNIGEWTPIGMAVESIFWEDLKEGGSFLAWDMVRKAYHGFEVARNATWSDNCTMAELGAVLDNDQQVTRIAAGAAAIDFAGSGRQVYKVALNKNRSFEQGPLKKLLVAGGYLIQDEKQVCVSPIAATLPRLSFYWVVPYSMENAWLDMPAKTLEEDEIVQEALKYVDQYVLTIDEDSQHDEVDDEEDEEDGEDD
jgi:hypothetical protein